MSKLVNTKNKKRNLQNEKKREWIPRNTFLKFPPPFSNGFVNGLAEAEKVIMKLLNDMMMMFMMMMIMMKMMMTMMMMMMLMMIMMTMMIMMIMMIRMMRMMKMKLI